jgi:DNA-binding NarL/FixJ family response regulator
MKNTCLPPPAPATPATPAKYRVFLVDDHPLLRRALADAITRDPNLTVCGQAEDVSEALAGVAAVRPDIVLTDIQLKSSNGLELIKTLHRDSRALPVVAISLFDLDRTRNLARAAGAIEFIAKQQGPEKMISLLHQVLKNRHGAVAKAQVPNQTRMDGSKGPVFAASPN